MDCSKQSAPFFVCLIPEDRLRLGKVQIICVFPFLAVSLQPNMKRILRIIFVALYIAVAIASCTGAWIYGTRFWLYFTNLGNIYCLGMMIIELVRLIRRQPISIGLMQWEFGGLISIIVISVVYNLLLGDPTTAAYWTNWPSIGLHLITPILYTLYFIITRPMRKVGVGGIQCSILLPYLYIAFIFLRYYFTGEEWFPYFFLDISRIGMHGVLMWIIALTVVFELVGVAFIYCGRHATKKQRSKLPL